MKKEMIEKRYSWVLKYLKEIQHKRYICQYCIIEECQKIHIMKYNSTFELDAINFEMDFIFLKCCFCNSTSDHRKMVVDMKGFTAMNLERWADNKLSKKIELFHFINK